MKTTKNEGNDILKQITNHIIDTNINNASNSNTSLLNSNSNNLFYHNQYKIDIKKIISDALNLKKSTNLNSKIDDYKRAELIQLTKHNAISNFLNNLQSKSIQNIKDAYYKKIKDISYNTQKQIDDFKKEKKNYETKYELLAEENKKQHRIILETNNKYRELSKLFKNSQNIISQMQSHDDFLKQNKTLYEEFIKHYPDEDPIKTIKELQEKKDGFFNLFSGYTDFQRNLENDMKEYDKQRSHNKKIKSILKERLDRIQEMNEHKKNDYELLINGLNNEVKSLQKLKDDNNKYRKILFELYSRLISSFKLNKKINIKPKFLKMTEKNFEPDVLDDDRIFKYINDMIKSNRNAFGDQVLRETIAYSNMMARVYLKNKSCFKYDPLNTFIELKSLMDEKEQKIIKLSDKKKDYEIQFNNMEIENKKLNNIINHINRERNKTLQTKESIRANFRSKSVLPQRLKKPSSKNNSIKKFNITKSKSNITEKNRPFTSQNKAKKQNAQLINSEIPNINNLLVSKNTKLSKSSSSSELNYEEIKEFKKINISKNRDKILKIHGQQPLVNYINEFNQLINHTNRLFIYKAKISPKNFYSSKKPTWKNNNELFLHKSKSCCNIEKKENENYKEIYDDKMEKQISNKITGIINDMQFKRSIKS